MRYRTLALILILTLAACSDSPTSPTPVLISYRVTGSATKALVTYNVEGGGQSQQEVTIPWQVPRYAKTGDILTLVAQNRDDSGCLTAAIWSSTRAVREATSCGAFVVATVSAVW